MTADKLMNLHAVAPDTQHVGPVTLYMPQFDIPPGGTEGNYEFSQMKVTTFTAGRADEVARAIIAAQSKMPINELSVDLLTLAYAYISERNG